MAETEPVRFRVPAVRPTTAVTALPSRLAGLAARAGLAPASMVTLSLTLACCAAAWLSGGTTTDLLRGTALLCASFLTGWAGRLLPGLLEVSPARAAAAGLLSRAAGVLTDYAVLAGLAAGAAAPNWHRPWELAAIVAALISLRTMLRTCRGRPAPSRVWPPGVDRLAVVAVSAPVWGTQAALLALAAWEIVGCGYALVPRRRAPQAGPAADGLAADGLAGDGLAGDGLAGDGWGADDWTADGLAADSPAAGEPGGTGAPDDARHPGRRRPGRGRRIARVLPVTEEPAISVGLSLLSPPPPAPSSASPALPPSFSWSAAVPPDTLPAALPSPGPLPIPSSPAAPPPSAPVAPALSSSAPVAPAPSSLAPSAQVGLGRSSASDPPGLSSPVPSSPAQVGLGPSSASDPSDPSSPVPSSASSSPGPVARAPLSGLSSAHSGGSPSLPPPSFSWSVASPSSGPLRVRPSSAQSSSAQSSPAQSSAGQSPAQTSAAQSSPAQTSAGQSSSAQTSAGQSSPAQTSAGQSPAQTSPAQLSPAQLSSAQLSAAQSPAQTSPAQPSAGQSSSAQSSPDLYFSAPPAPPSGGPPAQAAPAQAAPALPWPGTSSPVLSSSAPAAANGAGAAEVNGAVWPSSSPRAAVPVPGSGEADPDRPGPDEPGGDGSGLEADESGPGMWRPPVTGGRSPVRLARCRDDGVVARWLGRPVRGNLAALPPAIAGLTATVIVARLGLVGLPGPLVLTPVVAMLLASAGTSYRHARRGDWLVPAILQAGQFVFIGAVGFGRGVPAPVTFTLCAMVGLYYATLTGPVGRVPGRTLSRAGAGPAGSHWTQAGGLGWDGRMIFIGICAMAGTAMFAYLILTAYLGVLVTSKILTICHPEGVGR